MLEKLKNIKFFDQKDHAVIGIVLGEPIRYDILFLRKEGNDLSIIKSLTATDFDEIKKVVPQKYPIVLNFSGKGLIHRMVGAKGNVMKDVLFNARPEDFYTYEVVQDGHTFVSVSRREVVDSHITQFREGKFHIVDYSIGPFVASVCSGILGENAIWVLDGELSFSNGALVGFNVGSNANGPILGCKVGNDFVEGNGLVLMSSVLNGLYPSHDITHDRGIVLDDIKEHRRKRVFDFFLVASMLTFLIALLGSYLLLGHLNREYVRFEQQLYHFNDNYAHIKKMEEDLANKQFIVENSGVSNRKFLSFYINELVASTPSEILLGSVEVNPLEKRIKPNEPISLRSNTILVTGETNNSFFVNQWVKQMVAYPWVTKVEILNLNRMDVNKETFSLKLEIH